MPDVPPAVRVELEADLAYARARAEDWKLSTTSLGRRQFDYWEARAACYAELLRRAAPGPRPERKRDR